jgi:hypothetical protein
MIIANPEISKVIQSGNQTLALLPDISNLLLNILHPYALNPGTAATTIKIINKKKTSENNHDKDKETSLEALSAPCFFFNKLVVALAILVYP